MKLEYKKGITEPVGNVEEAAQKINESHLAPEPLIPGGVIELRNEPGMFMLSFYGKNREGYKRHVATVYGSLDEVNRVNRMIQIAR